MTVAADTLNVADGVGGNDRLLVTVAVDVPAETVPVAVAADAESDTVSDTVGVGGGMTVSVRVSGSDWVIVSRSAYPTA